MELPRHRPNPTIWICGPRAYTLCTFLIKRYCNCGLTSKHHGLQQHLHSRLPCRHRCPHRVTPPPPPLTSQPPSTTLSNFFFARFDDFWRVDNVNDVVDFEGIRRRGNSCSKRNKIFEIFRVWKEIDVYLFFILFFFFFIF